jgi:hypothetical protein
MQPRMDSVNVPFQQVLPAEGVVRSATSRVASRKRASMTICLRVVRPGMPLKVFGSIEAPSTVRGWASMSVLIALHMIAMLNVSACYSFL